MLNKEIKKLDKEFNKFNKQWKKDHSIKTDKKLIKKSKGGKYVSDKSNA